MSEGPANARAEVGVSEAPANARAEVDVSEAPANARAEVVASEVPASARAEEASAAVLVATTNLMMDLPRKCFVSTAQLRWSRVAAVLASALWWS